MNRRAYASTCISKHILVSTYMYLHSLKHTVCTLHMHICKHMHTHTRTHTHTHTHMRAHTYTRIRTRTNTHARTHTSEPFDPTSEWWSTPARRWCGWAPSPPSPRPGGRQRPGCHAASAASGHGTCRGQPLRPGSALRQGA